MRINDTVQLTEGIEDMDMLANFLIMSSITDFETLTGAGLCY